MSEQTFFTQNWGKVAANELCLKHNAVTDYLLIFSIAGSNLAYIDHDVSMSQFILTHDVRYEIY